MPKWWAPGWEQDLACWGLTRPPGLAETPPRVLPAPRSGALLALCWGRAPAATWGVLSAAPAKPDSPRARVSLQAPSVTIEGFLQALSLAVDKQFEERKKLSSCI